MAVAAAVAAARQCDGGGCLTVVWRRRGGGGSAAAVAVRWRRGGGGSTAAAHSATAAGDGRGEGKGDRRRDGTLRQRNARWCCDGDGRPVVFDDIEIKEEEIVREYDKGALPLVAMPLLLHVHLLVQGQGF